jgi:hypothetical protein
VARGVNLLVLDEPTNHPDLPPIEQLESVSVTRRLVVSDGQVAEVDVA